MKILPQLSNWSEQHLWAHLDLYLLKQFENNRKVLDCSVLKNSREAGTVLVMTDMAKQQQFVTHIINIFMDIFFGNSDLLVKLRSSRFIASRSLLKRLGSVRAPDQPAKTMGAKLKEMLTMFTHYALSNYTLNGLGIGARNQMQTSYWNKTHGQEIDEARNQMQISCLNNLLDRRMRRRLDMMQINEEYALQKLKLLDMKQFKQMVCIKTENKKVYTMKNIQNTNLLMLVECYSSTDTHLCVLASRIFPVNQNSCRIFIISFLYWLATCDSQSSLDRVA